MKNRNLFYSFLLTIFILSFAAISPAQSKSLIKRTTYKIDTVRFEPGGAISIVGAPNGSVSIEGWEKNEVEIAVDIEVQAETEADLAQLAQINNFVSNENLGHLSIISVGTHDKSYLKRLAQKIPKNLLSMPFKIDYRIKVPNFSNLEIVGGLGDLQISRVFGAMRINFLRSNAKLDLVGGIVNATFGGGNVDVYVNSRIGRESRFDVQLANGNVNVEVSNSLDAEINAKILRAGKIENVLDSLKPRSRAKFTEKLINAKAGKGGAIMSFIVGDGTIRIYDSESSGVNPKR